MADVIEVSGAAAPATRRALPVGHAGPIFPRELALALGCDVRELLPSRRDTAHAILQDWIDEKESAQVRQLIDAALVDGADALDGIVITRAFEPAYYYLRELQRLGVATLPMLHMFDLVSSRSDRFAEYNRRQVQDLFDMMRRITRRDVDQAALRAAIATVNADRQRLRTLHQARLDGRISGSEALDTILGTSAAGDGPSPAADAAGARTLLISSEPLLDGALHAAIEAEGFRVVAEDDGSGRFAISDDIDPGDDALEAIARHYAAIPTMRSHTREERLAHIHSVLSRGVDAVLCLVATSDQQLGWDIPSLRNEVEAAGATFVFAPLDTPAAAAAALVAQYGASGARGSQMEFRG
jgi:hypothetical protein